MIRQLFAPAKELDITNREVTGVGWPLVPRRKRMVLVKYDEELGNTQHVFQFAKGWGASVIRGRYTYGGPEGLWEMGVLRNGRLHYKNPGADGDVIGYLDRNGVLDALRKIAKFQ